ncbi:reverse transcriptase domain-containing protein [Tanacetum coccineum]
MRFPDVPSTSIKLMLFPFSLEGSARIWLEKEPPRSILTWDDLVSKFINQFFPPSKTTNLRNEITRFQQRFDESFYKAWDRFNDLLRACPHHGFSELHQLDTFYNALNANYQDSLNSAAGGNFLDKMPRECLRIIESKSKVRNSRNKAVVAKVSSNSSTPRISPDVAALTTEVSELKNLMKTILIDKQNTQAPATVKAVEQSCVTCGGAHSYKNCPATDGNIYQDNIQEYVSKAVAANFNQGNTNSRPPMVSNQIRPPGFPPIQNNQNRFNPNQGNNFNQNRGTSFNQNRGSNFNQGQANDAVLRNMQNQGQGLQNQMTNLTEMLSKFITSNTASSSNSGTLPSQTATNPREHVNAITTRSRKTCEGPSTPRVPTPVVSTPLKEPEQNPETSMDKVQKPSSENTAQVPPPEDHDSIFIEIPKPKAKKTVQEPNSLEPNSYQPKLPYPERMKVREKDTPSAQQSRFMKLFKQLRLEIGLKDALIEMPKFNKWLSTLLRNKEKLEEIAITTVNAECSAIILNKVPEKLKDPRKFLIPCALQELDRTNALADFGASINLLPHSIYKQLRLGALKPTRMTLELANRSVTHPMGIAEEDVLQRADAFFLLRIADIQLPHRKVDESYYDPEGDILILEALLNSDPSPPSNQGNYLPKIRKELKICEAKTAKSSIDETTHTPRVELKDLPPHLEYAFLEDNNKLPVIIAKDLSVDEKTALVKVLKSRKRAIAWKLSDIKVLTRNFVLIKSLMERGTFTEPAVQTTEKVNAEDPRRTVGENCASWSDRLDDALWAFCTTYKTPIGCTPYKLVYGKSCHLPIELEHRAYWALKHANFDLKTAGDHRKLQLNELNELRDQAYENSLIYKERTKKLHDSKIKNRIFNVGDQVLLFNSRLKIFSGKLKTRWSGPFTITEVFPYGTIDCKLSITYRRVQTFKVNCPPPRGRNESKLCDRLPKTKRFR